MSLDSTPYALSNPSHPPESSRLTLQHRIWLLQHSSHLHSTPLSPSQPQHVLDLCCGTGIWSTAFATSHPDSLVLGIDISPPPTSSSSPIPPNLSFLHANAETPWESFTAGRPPFTFIYGRMLSNSIRSWDLVLSQIHEHLVPGGYFQLDDAAHAFFAEDLGVGEKDSAMMEWWRKVFAAATKGNGIDLNAVYKHTGRLRDAGFRLEKVELVRWYLGRREGATEKENEIAELWVESIAGLVEGVTEGWIGREVDGEGGKVRGREIRDLAERAVKDIRENGGTRGYYIELMVHVARKEMVG